MGAQTAAVRAALDFAIETSVEHGGCVPRRPEGRRREKGWPVQLRQHCWRWVLESA